MYLSGRIGRRQGIEGWPAVCRFRQSTVKRSGSYCWGSCSCLPWSTCASVSRGQWPPFSSGTPSPSIIAPSHRRERFSCDWDLVAWCATVLGWQGRSGLVVVKGLAVVGDWSVSGWQEKYLRRHHTPNMSCFIAIKLDDNGLRTDNHSMETRLQTKPRQVSATVRKRILHGGERLWRLEDFTDLPGTAVVQSLSRLARAGVLERLSKGVYYRPRQTVFGKSHPNPAAIQRLASRRKKMFPAGIAAANLLGFTHRTPRTRRSPPVRSVCRAN